MSDALMVVESQQQLMVRKEQVQLLKDSYCKGASDQELALFVQVCNRLRLDPFARQIFAVKRWDNQLRREVMSAQTSIDGFRLVAERTGRYAGQTQHMWCDSDGVWKDVWLANTPPKAARVGVYRTGFHEPLFAVARYESYAQRNKEGQPNKMWASMPDLMLAKCAEALALRRAFPAELSGIYTSDEMGQATIGESDTTQAPSPVKNTVQQVKNLVASVTQPKTVDAPTYDIDAIVETIETAKSPEELASTADILKSTPMDSVDVSKARAAWKNKMEAFKTATVVVEKPKRSRKLVVPVEEPSAPPIEDCPTAAPSPEDGQLLMPW